MGKNKIYTVTTESVTEGHPDKVADQISDAVLDEILKQDIYGRVACETFVTHGLVIVGGEITTTAFVDIQNVAREMIRRIGYDDPKFGFDYRTCAVINAIGRQSPDIAQGVDRGGAGDQGIMYGYATDETENYMPLPINLAHSLTSKLAEARKNKILDYLGPDGKAQLTLEFENDTLKRIDSIVVSTQHTEEILDPASLYKKITEKSKNELKETIIENVIPADLIDKNTKIFINPTGKFVIGGPQSDTGMTGRKLAVDTYGGTFPHGGGAFSGKDPTKVDRSATYMARYLAKNIVASGMTKRCLVQIAYVIGEKDPVSFELNFYGTGKIEVEIVKNYITKNIDLTPFGIINYLDLRRPIFIKTATGGHFGRNDKDFTWEALDFVEKLKKGV